METKLPVNVAAKRMGIDAHDLRLALRQGAFPFGVAYKKPNSSQYSYYINKAQFERWANGEFSLNQRQEV